jgi:hypothetical protein
MLCRLCGAETISQDELINIFDNNDVAFNIKSKISYCLGINICENYGLPKFLCEVCIDNLEKFNEFKIKSHKTELLFNNLLKTNKISISNDNLPREFKIENDEKSILNSNIFEHLDIDMQLCEDNEVSNVKPVPPPSLLLKMPSKKVSSRSIKKKVGIESTLCKAKVLKRKTLIEHVKAVHNTVDIVKSDTKNSETNFKKQITIEYKCALCPRVSDTKRKIHRHMKTHSKIMRFYSCTMCHKKFKSEVTLTLHMKWHNQEYDYICSYCGQCFIQKVSFNYHIRAAHTKEYPFPCTKCDKKFVAKQSLKTHNIQAHSDVCSFACEICNRSFKLTSDLNAHKKTHTPLETRKIFKCHLCDASFVTNGGLQRHMFGHTGELKFGCSLCDKRYKDKGGLKIHLLIHSGEKNCVCDVCGKAFALKTNLKDHRRIHTGERPFKCNLCQKGFTQKSALNRHKKTCPGNK